MDGTTMFNLIKNQCEPTSLTITDSWIVWTDPCSVSIGRADAMTGAISHGGINGVCVCVCMLCVCVYCVCRLIG